ncbi:endolytic transglycosylase MltG [Bengtsoniella intestinalis]|uniref:endolytic transglycosylase MltG n=1 Tax=Bengtsoniella intestinalis TaxID=3073143 RepID=UPI00391EF3BB
MADLNETSSWNSREVREGAAGRKPRPAGDRHTNGQSNAQRPVKKRPRKRRNVGVSVLLWLMYPVVIVAISAALAGFGWLLACDLCAFNKEYMVTEIEVTEDDTVEMVADKLQEAGLIEYPWFFELFGVFSHAEENIGIGVHELNTDMDYRALITGMYTSSSASAETVTVTIPEGYTVAQTISLLADKGVNTEEVLTEAAQTFDFDYSFIDNESEDISRLEGYLFPDTYEFYVGESGSSALSRLITNFTSRISEYGEDIEASSHSLQELIVIASLIEKETDGTDHSSIASVIYNRLSDTGAGGTYGYLQIDAALFYYLPDGTTSLTNADKEVDSPYNLYKYAGLPPTAIANPGLNSILAALYPADTNYYYYALGTSGTHSFFTNYNDHVNFINSGEYGG